MRLDIACGQAKAEGFTGVDLCPLAGVDIVHNLNDFPWPFLTSSVDEARCSHYFEHVARFMRANFMSEVWRILKLGARIMIQTPYGLHRQFQDFSHAWPVFPESYNYFNRKWLADNGLSHYIDLYQIYCNFTVVDMLFGVADEFAALDDAGKVFAARHHVAAGTDLVVVLEKTPL